MAWSDVSSAISTIGGLLAQEALYLSGVEEQVDRLQTELKWMQSFIIEADAKQVKDKRIQLWVSEIRNLAYDAEDVIETFALKVASKRKGGFSNVIKRSACILKEGRMLHKTRSEIEKNIAKINDLTRRLQAYGIIKGLRIGEGSSSSNERQELRQSYPHIIQDYVVGLDNEIKKLVSVVTDENMDCRVVSICGMGGLGKTTLAKKLYHHNQVRDQFNHLAWVYVSQQCQKRTVWEDILFSLTSFERGSKQSDEELAKKLYSKQNDEELAKKLYSKQSDQKLAEELDKFLKDKKCLVILDDIWSIEAWESIKPALPMRETRSKILLTSRNREVASHADTRGYLHEMQCLNNEESWELLQKIAFPDRARVQAIHTSASVGCATSLLQLLRRILTYQPLFTAGITLVQSQPHNQEYKVDAKMEELGKDMVKHCAGLPLAITVLGGILATKYSSNEWQIVNENVKSYLKRGKGQAIDEVLALSYDDLPPHLKSCFLYLSHFPEDYEIHADRLIQLWIAEGIVSSEQEEGNGGEILEDVAECYLNELVERSMIRPEKRDAITGKIKICQMHDLMRDLCLSKAKEENFLYIFDHSKEEKLSSTIRRVRRVAAHEFVGVQCIQNQNLRSFLFFDRLFPGNLTLEPLPKKIRNYFEDHEDVNLIKCVSWSLLEPIAITKTRKVWRYIFNNFKLLRVLDFEGDSFYAAEGYKLPSDIGNLIHLKFLSLRGFYFLRSKLPSSLGNLRCLRTLDLRVESFLSSVHVPDVIWKMEQLRHLYLPEKCNRKTKLKLDTLRNLLTLVNFNTENCYLEDLLNMKKLRELRICGPFHIEKFEEDLEQNQPIIASKCLHSLSIVSDDIGPRHLAHLLSCCVNICEFIGSIGWGTKLPEYHHFSSNIAYICLSNSKIEEDTMPTLEKLPNLRILELDSLFSRVKMVCSAQGFGSLDSLSLHWLFNLKKWKVEEKAMPALRHLEIKSCPKLKMLPDGLKFITTLQELKIESMPKAFKDKVVEGGEDFCKFQHVPSIIFQNCDSDSDDYI